MWRAQRGQGFAPSTSTPFTFARGHIATSRPWPSYATGLYLAKARLAHLPATGVVQGAPSSLCWRRRRQARSGFHKEKR